MRLIGFVILSLALAISLPDSRAQAFFAGSLTFAINAGAVGYIASRLFERNDSGESGVGVSSSTSAAFVFLALIVKVFGLGICSYLSLVVAKFSPIFFVSGALLTLLFFVTSRLHNRRPSMTEIKC